MQTRDDKSLCKTNYYKKRGGTAGLSGQLYETKLLSLILLRALSDDNIQDFMLGTNIDGLGAFDDIVFKYKTNDSQEKRIVFIQVKHREDPNKDKLTVDDVMKQDGDFSLPKYLDSYIKIKNKFISDNDNVMLQNSIENIQCEFVIYTSAGENFCKKSILEGSNEESLLKTGSNGNIFKYKYDDKDVDTLVSTLTKSRAILLAKTLSKCILKDNFDNIMSDDLIKIYHVYLAQNVIKTEIKTTGETHDSIEKNNSHIRYRSGKFYTSFLKKTEDNTLLTMKHVVYEEIAKKKKYTLPHQLGELENFLESLTFKVPMNFGNSFFNFGGSETRQERRLKYTCDLFEKLFQSVRPNDSQHILITIDDASVAPEGIIQRKDLENKLAGLVGNFLIHDNDTDTFKCNLCEPSLSEDNIKILRRLQENYDLSEYRFDINIYSFPKLSLNYKEHDRALVKDFLDHLTFYTNQAKENDLEPMIKIGIDKFLNAQRQNESIVRVKCDAIFLKVHDQIQKWWQQPHSAPYLTKTCRFYQQAEQQILDSPLLNIINFVYNENYKKTFQILEFKYDVIKSLGLESFLNSDERIMIVITDQIEWSSRKVIQYFDEINKENNYLCLDFDFILDSIAVLKQELQDLAVSTLVVLSRRHIDVYSAYQKINNLTKQFKGKIVIIAQKSHKMNLPITNIVHEDNKNNFQSLSSKTCKVILEERKIEFQGVMCNVNSILDDVSLNVLSTNLLHKIINNENIVIGNTLYNNIYQDTIGRYINQNVCRYIKLNNSQSQEQNTTKTVNDKLDYLHYVDEIDSDNMPSKQTDIVLTTESKNTFDTICSRYKERNIHWFEKKIRKHHHDLIWRQTHGSLHTIIKYIDRCTHVDFTIRVKTLKDIPDKVVIISAEPGMGKSTLLTHLAINTKCSYPNLWILRINLLDHIDQYIQWKERRQNIDILQVMIFLYSIIYNEVWKRDKNFRNKVSDLLSVNDINEIHLIDHDNQHLDNVDLSEIKLFNYFYNSNNVAILFDGFDEICPDYASEVIQLLCTLKSSKIAHLWVTSRPYNVLHDLESALETFSFNLNPLNDADQIEFLHSVWFQRLALPDSMSRICKSCVGLLYYEFMTVLDEDGERFMSLPLHLYMIAEIYEYYFKDYFECNTKRELPQKYITNLQDFLNLITLFDKFTNKKFFTIRFGEKKHSMNFKDPDMRKIIDKERKLFMENHKKLAAYILFDRSVVLSKDDIKDVREFMASIKIGEEKTGIVERIIEDDSKFVHYTFAEYFAVEYLFEKLISENCASSTWKYFLSVVLVNENYGIRRFINSKLQRDRHIIVAELERNENFMNMVCNILLDQENSLLVTAIHCALDEDYEYITLFLIQCATLSRRNLCTLIKIINLKINSNLGLRCLFCYAIDIQRHFFVESLLQVILKIDRSKLRDLFLCNDTDQFSPLLLASGYPKITQIILSSLQHDPDLIVELYTLPHKRGFSFSVAHFLGKHCFPISFCWMYLLNLNLEQRVKIFSVKDVMGQLPLHYAGDENDYSFFFTMEKLLGGEEFRKMCKTTDNLGFTPICLLTYIERYFHMLKLLLQKVYLDPAIDLEDFVYNKLPELYPKTLDLGPNPSFEFSHSSKVGVVKYLGRAYYVDEAYLRVRNQNRAELFRRFLEE